MYMDVRLQFVVSLKIQDVYSFTVPTQLHPTIYLE